LTSDLELEAPYKREEEEEEEQMGDKRENTCKKMTFKFY
jgi:hypothetical protein